MLADKMAEFIGLLAREKSARARLDRDTRDGREIASAILDEIGFPALDGFVANLRAMLSARDATIYPDITA